MIIIITIIIIIIIIIINITIIIIHQHIYNVDLPVKEAVMHRVEGCCVEVYETFGLRSLSTKMVNNKLIIIIVNGY